MDIPDWLKWLIRIVAIMAFVGIIISEWVSPAATVFGAAESSYFDAPLLPGGLPSPIEAPIWMYTHGMSAMLGPYLGTVVGVAFGAAPVVLVGAVMWWLVAKATA